MNEDLEHIEQVDLYLRGKLDPESLEDFLSKMASNPAMASEVETQRLVNQVIKGAHQDILRSRIQNDIHILDSKPWYKKFFWIPTLMVLALAILGGIFFYDSNPTESNSNKKIDTPAAPSKPISKTKPSEKVNLTQNNSVLSVNPEKKSTKKPLTPASFVSRPLAAAPTPTTAESLQPNPTVPAETPSPSMVTPTEKAQPIASKEEIDCRTHKISASPTVSPACEGQSDGKIIFNESTKGSISPFEIVKHNNKSVSDAPTQFWGLKAGEHSFYLKDPAGCTQSISVLVPSKSCVVHQFSINPSLGESVRIQTKSGLSAQFSVRNNAGALVYTENTSPSQSIEWHGASNQGVKTPPNVYFYTLEYEDGSFEKGQITLTQ